MIINCPLCGIKNVYDTFTEFWQHVMKRHSAVLSAECDRLSVDNLSRAHARRLKKDASIQEAIARHEGGGKK